MPTSAAAQPDRGHADEDGGAGDAARDEHQPLRALPLVFAHPKLHARVEAQEGPRKHAHAEAIEPSLPHINLRNFAVVAHGVAQAQAEADA
eukprot:CAMPEP_0118878370 /NCGR_PEP_ID=MMETSP1163-20130328/18290_1 /TAXON_ID=124430 /ORGANISM="Phaeomonas parva, Strain CCMP2877" /LENGTH=90 /DNA_ID=CAMNT_0006814183 /DNA_START=597 /DNA_END=871 /DNA_ORIENTATION=+